MLTGDGGDESFGGYTRYLPNRTLDALGVVPNTLVRAAARASRVAFTRSEPHATSRLTRWRDWIPTNDNAANGAGASRGT